MSSRIELLPDGYRAVDPVGRLRYVIKRAPDDAVVTRGAETLEDGALVRVVDLRTEQALAGRLT